MLAPTRLATTVRRYSQRATKDPLYRLKAYAALGYLGAAFTLPFVPPYLASRWSKQDGSWLTR